DSSDSDEDVYFMTHDDEVHDSPKISYDELASMYDELCKEMLKVQKKNKALKEMMISVGNELDDFKNEYKKLEARINDLDEDNEFLRYENNNLRNENGKLCKGHKALNIEIGKLKIQNLKEDKFCDDELMQ